MPATSDNTFAYMLETADSYLGTFVTNGVTAMQGSVALTFTVIGGVYFALYGWMMMYGYVQGTITDLVKQAAKFFVAYMVATQGALYALIVVDFFWNVPEAVGDNLLKLTADAAGSPDDTKDSISNVFETYQQNLTLITDKVAKSGRVVPDILAGILAVVMQIPIIAAVFIVLIAKIGLSIMLVLGPLLIIAALFGWTKGLFEGWLRQVLTFVMTAILAYAVIALLMSMLHTFATDLNGAYPSTIKWVRAIPLALMAIICSLVFLQVPQFAAGLVGGIGIGDMGATRFGASKARQAGMRTGRAMNRGVGFAGSKTLAKVNPKLLNAIQQKAPIIAQNLRHYSGERKVRAQDVNVVKPKGDDT